MKTMSHSVLGRVAIAALLVLIATCSDAEARAPGKVVKPPRGAPAPQTRTLNMPSAYASKIAAQGRVHRGLAASKLVAPLPSWTIVRESAHQTSIFMESNQPQPAAKRSTAIAPETHVLQFISENAALFRLRDPSSELVHRATTSDRENRKHVQLEQRYLGVPVWGASIVGHWSTEKGLYAINGNYQPSPHYITQVEPSITPEAAIDLALGDLRLHGSIKTLSPKMQELLDYRGPEAELYLWNARPEEPVRLTWVVEIRPNLVERWRYFVDAHTGQVLERYQASPSDGPTVGWGEDLLGNTVSLNTSEIDGLYYLLDLREYPYLETLDAKDTDSGVYDYERGNYERKEYIIDWSVEPIASPGNFFDDPTAVSAHHNMTRVYEYFLQHHGRNGIFLDRDDNPDGRRIISVINVTDGGKEMDNAFWNGVAMFFGNGQEDFFSPAAGSLDIVAHEMTHGIIEQTVNLVYTYESGALNESLCDIFGAMVDKDDWLILEDSNVNRDKYPSGAMRDLSNPHNGDVYGGAGWQPAHMAEFQFIPLDEDHGGVHTNSGIHNRAAYLIAKEIGREKTADIYYRILEERRLDEWDGFYKCRLAAEAVARDRFDANSFEAYAVSRAYDEVGIDGSWPQWYGTKKAIADGSLTDPGTHWVAIVAAERDGDSSLWLVKPTSDPIEGREGWEYLTQLTTTQVYPVTGRPIAAPFNSDHLLFVDSDNNLRYINADGSDEEVISTDGDWHSIALSPDGSRVVATTVYDEPWIWYLDLDQPDSQWIPIKLYQPTTQAGIRQNIARFADVLQWDATGTVVIYDVLNSMPGPRGETIDFWTVNALEPATETIWPLFPAQPEGVQISSPSLSSAILPDGTIDDCRLLYERVDFTNARTEISVMDFCTGEEGVLYTVSDAPSFTFPGFINGDREIVFQLEGIENGVETVHLFRQPLTEDGLSSQGELLLFMLNALFPHTMILDSDVSAEITQATPPPAPDPDFDRDGTVGFPDFLQFVAQFGLSRGDAGYDARFDLDGDGTIGFGDFLVFANAFGNEAS